MCVHTGTALERCDGCGMMPSSDRLVGSNATSGPATFSVDEIKYLRQQIDVITKRVEQSGYLKSKDQVIIKLREAKMWLGKCLEELGHRLPKEYWDTAE